MTEPRRPLFGRIRALPLARVLVVYGAASWVVVQVIAIFASQFGLPAWFFPASVALLLIGLPIILGTAIVQDWLRHAGEHVPLPDFEVEGERRLIAQPGAGAPAPAAAHALSRWLTWRKSILGGVLAFTALGIVGVVIVLRGSGRVTEAYGEAGGAFGARSWILVTDFEAPPDEPDLAAAVREALTVDLQQSRYVNVYGRSQIAGVLRLMQLPDTIPLSQEIGLEIGQREGLGAVLAGRISRLGDNYVLSARVLQPSTGEELVAVRATAARDRALEAVEALSREVRSRLGESRAALRASRRLPQVTTRSLEALQRYAQAEEALARGDQEQAIDLAEAAIALDPEFAMAYRLAGVSHGNLGRWSEAERYTTRAYELRDKLSERERLHIEARYAERILEDAAEAVTKYELILSTYPDDSRAANNLAVNAWYIGDHERAYRSALRSVALDPYIWQGYSNAIWNAHRLGQWAVADSLVRLAMSRGLTERATRFLWRDAVAQGDWARVDALCDSLLASAPVRSEYRGDDEGTCGILDIARGRIGRATERLRRAAEIRSRRGQLLAYYGTIADLVQAELLRGRRAEAQAALKQALAQHPLDSVPKPDWFPATYAVASSWAQLGDRKAAERLAAAYSADTTTWDRAAWLLRLEAAVALAAGAYEKALDYDRRAVRRHFGNALAYDQLYRAQAFDGLRQRDSAIVLYEEVASPRSIAAGPSALTLHLAYLPVVHQRLGELYADAGDRAKAAQHYAKFLELWSNPDPELRPQVEAVRRALAQLGGERAGT